MGVLSFLQVGCATNRGIIDVRVVQPQNPANSQAVKIVTVRDLRVFELKPASASIPSLKNGEINDASITHRAIARKRNGYGKAMGDILLPEGQTVEGLTRDALARAFKEKGYTVLDAQDAGYDQAEAVEADIEQFWAWVTPGFWAASLEFEALVKVKNPTIFLTPEEAVRGSVLLHTQAAGTSAWMNILNKGLEDFIQKAQEKMKEPKTLSSAQ
ncbi:MAG TPA: flagellar biosynthesis protein [Verrucomicrobia bacterium]|nr:flagellar biosynthesis protein [Verrucomicrobiota bacterium]